MAERPTLLVMAKTPRLGHGKTRLASSIGAAAALRINRALQARVLRRCRDPRWRTVLVVAPDRDVRAPLPGVWPRGVSRIGQGDGDLGARLARAFRRFGGKPIAVIGVDCPDTDRLAIAAAFKGAMRRGAAIGPTADGGFWILSVRDARAAAPAFSEVRWSTSHACADMAAALGGAVQVRALTDIDTAEDWRAWAQRRARRPRAVEADVASMGR